METWWAATRAYRRMRDGDSEWAVVISIYDKRERNWDVTVVARVIRVDVRNWCRC